MGVGGNYKSKLYLLLKKMHFLCVVFNFKTDFEYIPSTDVQRGVYVYRVSEDSVISLEYLVARNW